MPGVLDSAAKRRRGVRPRHQRLLRNSGALTTVEQVCRNPVPQARNNRSPARSRRRSAGLSGKLDRSPDGRHRFVTASSCGGSRASAQRNGIGHPSFFAILRGLQSARPQRRRLANSFFNVRQRSQIRLHQKPICSTPRPAALEALASASRGGPPPCRWRWHRTPSGCCE